MTTRKKVKARAYEVAARTSTRASIDPESPDYETWVNFEVGDVVKTWPKHAPVDEWVASGHWIDPDAPKDPEEPAP